MSNINLLPWREVAKRREKQFFLAVLGGASVVALLLVFSVNFIIEQSVSRQDARNAYLQSEMNLLTARIGEIEKLKKRRAELIERMRLIDQLQQSRNLAVHLYSDLPTLVTNGVYLNSLSFVNGNVDISGKTEAHSRVANMMRMIDKSGWLGQTNIKAIYMSTDKSVPLSEFSMAFKVLKTDVLPVQEKTK